jgi:AcrR family transcriptional regulator
VIRVIPAGRFAAVVAAAARVFIAHGYQRAQVQDVADVLGLGKGTLYGYASGKAALFAAAVRYADGHEPLPPPADLPIPAPAEGEIAMLVASRLAAEIADMQLTRALNRHPPARAEVGAELAGIVTDLYQRLAKHRTAIKLVDRCAPELPDLAALWFGAGRQAQAGALATYLTSAQDAGTLSLPGPAPLVARTVIELCTLWAVHCHFDPAPAPPGAEAVDDTAVAAMLAALIVRATTPPQTPTADAPHAPLPPTP